MSVFQFYPEHSIGKGFYNGSVLFDQGLFRHTDFGSARPNVPGFDTLFEGVSERAGKDKRIYLKKEKTGVIFTFLTVKNNLIFRSGVLRQPRRAIRRAFPMVPLSFASEDSVADALQSAH
jgi:hypothetical protein